MMEFLTTHEGNLALITKYRAVTSFLVVYTYKIVMFSITSTAVLSPQFLSILPNLIFLLFIVILAFLVVMHHFFLFSCPI